MKPTVQIEYPSAGATYSRNEYGVYSYDVYPDSSVLAGQTRRSFLNSFETLDEARAAYPDATVVDGSHYAPPYLGHLIDGDEDGDVWDYP